MIRTNKYDNCLAVLITCIVWILMQLQLNPQKIVNVIFLGFCWYTPLLLLTSFMSLGWQVWIIYRCQSNYEEFSMLIKIRKLTVYQRVKLGIKLDLLNIVLAFLPQFLILVKYFSWVGLVFDGVGLLTIGILIWFCRYSTIITLGKASAILIVLRLIFTLLI